MWQNDLVHGKGTFIWPDKSKFEGHFIEGKKYGKGTYIYSTGTKYSGDWVNNIIQGLVILYHCYFDASRVSITGQMAVSIKELGKITTWMDMGYTFGKIEGNTVECM